MNTDTEGNPIKQ